MDWTKDEKNKPIVIGVSVVVLVGAIVFLLFQFGVIGGSGGGGTVPPPPTGIAKSGPMMPGQVPGAPPMPGQVPGAPPMPGQVPGAPPMPGQVPGGPMMPGRVSGAPPMPGQMPGAPTFPGAPGAPISGAVKQAAAVPKKSGPADPFKAPASALPATLQIKPTSVATLLPWVEIARTQPKTTKSITPITPIGGAGTEVSTTQRMSGVLFTDKGIVGLLETNGQTQQVYPGDTVNDGSARVISIQSDGLVLRRTSDNHLVRVPLSGVATGPGVGGDLSQPAPPDNTNNNGTDTANPGNDVNTDNL